MRRPALPTPTSLLVIAALLVPAWVGAQERQDATAATASSTGATSVPPADTQARAPAKSRSLLGQAMVELTRSVEASRKRAPPPATAPPAHTQAPRDQPQVAAQDPVD